MKIRALIVRIIRQFFHDKRSLALMFAAPLLVLTLMYLVLGSSAYEPKIAAVALPHPVAAALESKGARVIVYDGEQAEQAIRSGEVDAILRLDGTQPEMMLEGSDPAVSRAVMMILQQTLQPRSGESQAITVTYLHGNETLTTFDHIGPVLIGFFSFFFVFLLSGISFLRERTAGTLERLLASPVRRSEVVAGYLLGFGLFAALQSAVIVLYTIGVLDLHMSGSILLVLLVNFSLAIVALTLGTFLSAYAANEFQMVQFIPLVIVPQVFFSGLFNLDAAAEWIRWLSYAMPLSYGAEALRGVMLRGEGWTDVAPEVCILFALALLLAFANIFALRKHRKI